jgi:hypothetical protein
MAKLEIEIARGGVHRSLNELPRASVLEEVILSKEIVDRTERASLQRGM